MFIFELENVAKRYGETLALAQTTLEIEAGKTIALIGPSGSGKSTLLRVMIGLVTPDSGAARFEGQIITPQNVTALRRKMGFVVQEGGLFPHMKADANVTLMAQQSRWDKGRVEQRLLELAELTDFPHDALTRYPAQLSGGQRQRISLMRALMLDPDVLLLDEPLGALDPMIRFDLQNDLKAIFRSLNKTVILVTHDLAEAGFFADRMLLMRAGRIVQQGSLEDLTKRPAEPFVERFLTAQRFFPHTREQPSQ